MSVEGLDVDRFASDLRVLGSVDQATLDLSGAASADLTEAELRTAEVDLSGGSRVEFGPLDRVEGELSGGSEISGPDGVDASVETSGGAGIERS